MERVISKIEKKENEDWHVAYAKLGFVDVALQKCLGGAVQLLTHYASFKWGANAWRVRECAAKMIIYYGMKGSPEIQKMM